MKQKLLILLACLLMGLSVASAQTEQIQKKKEFVVSRYGALKTGKGYIADASGDKVSLMGPSLHWSYAAPTWWSRKTVNYLVDQYHIQIIRLPVTIAPGSNGGQNRVEKPSDIITEDCYYWHPEETKQMVDEVVKAAIENDIYVIIDFHEHYAQDWTNLAKEFFTYFATKWGNYPNVMYEIYNEPVCDNGTVVNYAKQVIPVIRAIDPDNIIIVGSAQYSREPQNVTGAGQGYTNIAYSWHGYPTWGHQGDWNSSDADSWNTTIPVIVTEWGMGNSGSDGGLLDIYKSRGVINCFWSMSNIGGDEEIWSVLKSDCTKKSGWTTEDMTENGVSMLNQTKGWVNFYPVDLDIDDDEVYTEFVEETGTLTYYYDDQREERTGVTELYDGRNHFKGYASKVKKAIIDPSMKNAPLTLTDYMFFGHVDDNDYTLSAMTAIEGLENLNTANVVNMKSMFMGCSALTSLDLSSFNTGKVIYMDDMFYDCSALTSLDLSSFDIGNVITMLNMFCGCSSLKTIYCDDDWSTGSVQYSDGMFRNCYSLVGGEGTVFDNKVTDKTYARLDGGTGKPGYFTKKPKYEVYTEFDESTGTLIYYYDSQREERTGSTELYDPVNDRDAVRFVEYSNKVLKAVIDPSMKSAPLTSMYSMFFGGMGNSIYSLPNMTEIEGLENLNTAIVTNMNSMFISCMGLTYLDLSSFDTRNVTNMNGMLLGCNNLKIVDVSSFDLSSLTDMRLMFSGCLKLTTIYCSNDWSTSPAQSDYMFSVCNSLVGGEGTVFNDKVKDKAYARPDGGTSAPGYFTEKPTYLVGDANGNGEVEIGDVTSVLTLMATPEATGYNNKAADANGNGEIEIGDVTTILTIMANGGE